VFSVWSVQLVDAVFLMIVGHFQGFKQAG
jgi:hypothetical protein